MSQGGGCKDRAKGDDVDQPWGLSAAQFLTAYLIVLVGCQAGAIYTRAKVRASSARMSHGTPALEVYETAYLAGGPTRVIDTAVAGLAGIGRIRVGPDGRLSWVGQLARQPVELAVSEQVNQGVGRLSDLRRTLSHHAAVMDIGRRLAERHLVAGESKVRLAQLASWSLVAPLSVGMVRLVTGLLAAGRLDSTFALLVIVNAASVVWLIRTPVCRTWYGDSVLRSVQQTTPLRHYPGAITRLRDPLGLAGVGTVALFGLEAVDDRALRAALELSG
jgi:uncharacterized protein (TIGR04222 family)